MSNEIWRPVPEWEGLYEVSSTGRVRSINRVSISRLGRKTSLRGRVLKQRFGKHYYKVELSRSGVHSTAHVHQLVCKAFHGPRPPGAVVRHLDGNGRNNHKDNLAWGTWQENSQDMLDHDTAYWANKTHCKYGHEFTESNTRLDRSPNGGTKRSCRECERRRAIPKNRRRDELKRVSRPWRLCAVCGERYQSAYQHSAYCSTECRKMSRRVGYKRRAARQEAS
ncbi:MULTISPECIES: NUMOD4 motif-containing HNH endonuclease [unclassified Mycobacteroides]|uniref:NUMOD4 motif-containing HNH endonuclease n=1 Tax=unclassified Mycobacteroides TaxID=2618759 RepID=UPI0009E74299